MIRQFGIKRGKVMGIKHLDLSPHRLEDSLGLQGDRTSWAWNRTRAQKPQPLDNRNKHNSLKHHQQLQS